TAAHDVMEHLWDWRTSSQKLLESVRRAGITKIWSGELPVLSFELSGRSPQDVEEALDRDFGIVVRSGLHCAPEAHQVLGTLEQGTVRVSTSVATTDDEFNALTEALVHLRTHEPN
ncbi:MAG: aminotransferase class V-fold PLP-dependent enzyme, partial [Myxococcota bacterium]